MTFSWLTKLTQNKFRRAFKEEHRVILQILEFLFVGYIPISSGSTENILSYLTEDAFPHHEVGMIGIWCPRNK